MIGLGTIINTVAIIAGGLFGLLFKKKMNSQFQDTMVIACATACMFIAIAGALEGLLQVDNGKLTSCNGILLVACLLLGSLIGELLNLNGLMERFGKWLQLKSNNIGDSQFVHAFILSSCTLAIGAMAILGSIYDGVSGDYTLLATKAVLDGIMVMMLSAKMGKGCVFSAVPVFLFEGSVTLCARFIAPILTDAAILNLSFVGNVLIFCISLNLIFDRNIKVLNMLPSMFLAAIAAYIQF